MSFLKSFFADPRVKAAALTLAGILIEHLFGVLGAAGGVVGA